MKITNFALYSVDGSIFGWGSSGNPTIATFSGALQVWALAQEQPPTVADAALAFNVTPAMIRAAIDQHTWMFVGDNDVIEHDGE